MYHKLNIHKLSPTQIGKLLNGHRIRVKHGHGHEIHASEEQHKKIMRAHHKGCGATIQFDPYQMEHHAHMRGHGGGSLGSVVKSVAKKHAPHIIDELGHLAKNHINGLGTHHAHHTHHTHHAHHAHEHGGALNPAGYGSKRKVGRPRKGHGVIGNIAKSTLKAVAPIVIDELAHLAKHKIGHGGKGGRRGPSRARKGHGIACGEGKKRGRPKKGHGIGNDILNGIKKYGPEVAKYAPLALSFL